MPKHNIIFGAILWIIVLCCCSSALADEVTCYSNGIKIYHGFVEETVYNENLNVLWFVEPKAHNFVFIEGMDCIVKLKMRD